MSSFAEDLVARIRAGYPLLVVKTHEEERCLELIRQVAEDESWETRLGMPAGVVSAKDPKKPGASSDWVACTEAAPEGILWLICRLDRYLDTAQAARDLRETVVTAMGRRQTLIVIDPDPHLPVDLEKLAITMRLPLPGTSELRSILQEYQQEISQLRQMEPWSVEDEDSLLKGLAGLTLHEARMAIRRAMLDRTQVDEEAIALLISEKKALASGTEFLTFYDLKEGAGDVGGLDQLKEWLEQRSRALSPSAREQGIPAPKGVFLVGVQGCGKSLSARVTARVLGFPLIRLDVTHLLTGTRGGPEENLRRVLQTVENVAPAVLWLDEIEKGFAGAEQQGGGAPDATMARLLGSFLTWISELERPVFLVATANSVQSLPPELLRRGRFDELFFIDLPNIDERVRILQIHLEKRGWNPGLYDVEKLARQAEGYSGAELEQLVSSAIVESFSQGRILDFNDLEVARRSLIPLSQTAEDQVFALRQWAEGRCRKATSDHRVVRMLDDEQQAEVRNPASTPLPPPIGASTWEQLAAHGQTKAAVVEFVRQTGEAGFGQLLEGFGKFMPTTGEYGLRLKQPAGVLVTTGLSREFATILDELFASRRIYLRLVHPAHELVVPPKRIPISEAIPSEAPPRPVFLPCLLRLSPDTRNSPSLQTLKLVRLGASSEENALSKAT